MSARADTLVRPYAICVPDIAARGVTINGSGNTISGSTILNLTGSGVDRAYNPVYSEPAGSTAGALNVTGAIAVTGPVNANSSYSFSSGIGPRHGFAASAAVVSCLALRLLTGRTYARSGGDCRRGPRPSMRSRAIASRSRPLGSSSSPSTMATTCSIAAACARRTSS